LHEQTKREVQPRRLELATKELNCDRRKPGELRQLFIEQLARFPPFLLVTCYKGAERKNGRRPLGERFAVLRQEAARVLVPTEHVERRSQHPLVVSCEGAHFPLG
jgi:hypothetical protein